MPDRTERTWVVLDINLNRNSVCTQMHVGDPKEFKKRKPFGCSRHFLTRNQTVEMMSELVKASKQVGWMIADA
jgi:hypothetical protein